MAKCEYCGTEIELPFKCNYCGKYFCEAHRLLENHNCSDAPPRTPLGSFQTKQMLTENAKKREMEIAGRNVSFLDWNKTETQTHGNVYGHCFSVPMEVYSEMHFHQLHASGHLNKDQLIDLINHIAPSRVFPVHTENQQLFKKHCNNVQTIKYGEEYIL